MSLVPAPSASRGDVVLQPTYFTSSIYVKALRDDISTLVLRYHEVYSQPQSLGPFALFKSIWLRMGWHWLQFKVFDNRSRQTFLDVTMRLFLERTVKTEAPFTRAVAIFGFYTFFYTQIKDTAPPLYCLTNIPIPCDHYISLMSMADTLSSPQMRPLQPHVQFLLCRLKKEQVFFILPKSELGAMKPRELPREVLAEDDITFSDHGGQKRKGRPARREKGKKARLALEAVDSWLSRSGQHGDATRINNILGDYQAAKTTMVKDGGIPAETIEEMNESVLERLKEAQAVARAYTIGGGS